MGAVRFVFDCNPNRINPSQTPQDLSMEDGDADATVWLLERAGVLTCASDFVELAAEAGS